jgi:ABC-type uncharacterized transport system permease subunit
MVEPNLEVKALRQFAATLFSALALLGAVLIWRKREAGFILWGIGTAALLLAWLRPLALRPVHQYWMKLARMLGFISSHVILAVLYYLMVTPLGLVMRGLGKNPLALRPEEKAGSYWIKRNNTNTNKQRYEKMY